MAADETRGLRARAQRLDVGRGKASVEAVVAHLVAVQAQDLAAASLGIGVRADGLTAAEVDRARNVERSIVRTWCLRGTLHLVAARDVRWLLDLVRPGLETGNRTRRQQLGLDDADTARGVALVCELLADGPSTRPEIAAQLRRHGVASEGQATIHVIWRAAIAGFVCCGPDRGSESTFVLLDEWVGQTCRPADPLGELVMRYRAAYGPAAQKDFAAWSGLPRKAIDRAWTDVGKAEKPPRLDRTVRLLPAYDSVWVGYRDHSLLVADEFAKRVFPGGGLIRPIVFTGGRAVGTWSRRTTRRGIDISVDLFETLDEHALSRAVIELGRFLQAPARLVSTSC